MSVGDNVTLGVHMDRVHLFDPESGTSLTTADRQASPNPTTAVAAS